MDKLQKLSDILIRLKSESPEFFKKFQSFAWLGTACSLIVVLLDVTGVFVLPETWQAALWVITGVLFGSASTSHLPVKSSSGSDGPGPGGEPPKPPKPKP